MQIMTQLYLKTYLTIIYMHAVISSLYGIQVSLFFFFFFIYMIHVYLVGSMQST